MSFSDLPHIMLSLVLRAALSENEDLDEFKDNLPLVAVCRRWRCLALPLICSNAHMWYDNEDMLTESSSSASSSYDYNSSAEDSPDGYSSEDSSAYNSSGYIETAKTNLGLIASVGCVSFVKHVHIGASFTSGYIDTFRVTAKLMRNAATTWPGVNTLNVSAYPWEPWPSRWANAKDYKKEII
ncbi:hypothetical protein LPJ61_005218 [Coemansia biformis]|uniref:F-box domain-containing protein n=1 Tax=Coemansia biformis TaxID=1286918 RepID=A0A9W7Y7U2_9FUNG|nr:hypothetical protein LPJ61_005218 [Coemansia biformis]